MTDTKQMAHDVSQSPWYDRAVRVGLAAYGVMHVLIGWLALQLALGDREGAASQQGAMRQLVQQSYGELLLWLVAFGFACLVIWQAVEALIGHRGEEGAKRTFKRLGSVARVVVYAVLAFTAAQTAAHAGSSSSNTDKLTRDIMKLPLGQVLVGLGGAALIVLGGYLVYRGLSKGFESSLKPGVTSSPSGRVAVRLAMIGYPAKGAALGAVGLLFVVAAWTFNADKAGGLDVALRNLLDEPFGPWLIGAIGVGLAAYGLYCFFRVKYAQTSPYRR
jgi:hypothetical protein